MNVLDTPVIDADVADTDVRLDFVRLVNGAPRLQCVEDARADEELIRGIARRVIIRICARKQLESWLDREKILRDRFGVDTPEKRIHILVLASTRDRLANLKRVIGEIRDRVCALLVAWGHLEIWQWHNTTEVQLAIQTVATRHPSPLGVGLDITEEEAKERSYHLSLRLNDLEDKRREIEELAPLVQIPVHSAHYRLVQLRSLSHRLGARERIRRLSWYY